MAPRIVRGQLALDIGERLSDLGRKVSSLEQFSGEARDQQVRLIHSSLIAEINRLLTLVRSCRGAKNGYANYPSLRRVIAKAGDEVYDLYQQLQEVYPTVDSEPNEVVARKILTIAQQIKLVSFVTEEKAETPV